jgi:hypothetical protein
VNTEEREKAFRYDNHVLSLGHWRISLPAKSFHRERPQISQRS